MARMTLLCVDFCRKQGHNWWWLKVIPFLCTSVGICILPHRNSPKLTLFLSTVFYFWTLHLWPSASTVHFDLTILKKTHWSWNMQTVLPATCSWLSETIYTGSSKIDEVVTVADVSTRHVCKPFACGLPDDSSVYSEENLNYLLSHRHVYYSQEKFFLILSDSLLSLQAISNKVTWRMTSLF